MIFLGMRLGNLPEEPPTDRLEDVPTDEDPEVVGRNIFETNGRSKLTDKTDAADHEAGQSQTLGAGGCLQGLGGNDTLKRSVGEGKDSVEEIVESKGGLTLGLGH